MPLGNEEQQQPHMKVSVVEAPEGLKELVNQFSDDHEVYVSEEIQMEDDPTSFEEAVTPRCYDQHLGTANHVYYASTSILIIHALSCK